MRESRQLIRELAEGLEPVRAVPSPLALTAAWLAGSWLFVTVAMLLVAPMRPGFLGDLQESPRFALETLLGVAAGFCAIGTAFAMAIPGPVSSARRLALALGGLLLWAGAYVYGLHDPALEPSMAGKRPTCVYEVVLWGAPVMLAGLAVMRRMAPLDRVATGVIVGAASGAIPALLMQIGCMYEPAHILSYHLAPVIVLAGLGAVAGPLLLRRI
jgi:hypothetical protein